MRTIMTVAFVASALCFLSPESRGEMVTYDISGSVAALEFGSYYGPNPAGGMDWIETGFAWRPGTLDFQFQYTFDTEQEGSGTVTGGFFEAGDLTLSQEFLFQTAYHVDGAPGEGPDEFHVWLMDFHIPENFYGEFHLIDPTGNFFETGDLTFAQIRTSLTLTPTGRPAGPNYYATGRSVSLTAVPEPSSLALAAVAGLGGLGAALRARRRSA